MKIPATRGGVSFDILEARMTEPVDPNSEGGRTMTPEEREPKVFIRFRQPGSHVVHNAVLRPDELFTVLV